MRWVVCLVLAAAVVAPARADELADALRTLQQRYESTRTLVAKFRQEVESPTMAGKLTSNGTVSFEKPNRMRWDYAAPDRQTIVSDGETLWIYQPEEKQVLKAPLREAFQATTPVTFLGGLGHVDRDFTPTLESSADDRWVLKLVPPGSDAAKRAQAGLRGEQPGGEKTPAADSPVNEKNKKP